MRRGDLGHRTRQGGIRLEQCATYLSCDDGADAIEASVERAGNERELEP